MHKPLSEESISIILESYGRLGNAKLVSQETGFSTFPILKYVNRAGLKNPYCQRKYSMDDRFFETIDSQEKAYFFGLLAADGCIFQQGENYKIILTLQEQDSYIVKKLKEALKADNPVRIGDNAYRNDQNRSKIAIFSVSSKKMFSDLQRLGFCPRKSDKFTFPSPEQVPSEFVNHFVRGYFDGDGCVCKYYHKTTKQNRIEVSFCGTKEFLESLRKYLETKGIVVKRKLTKRHKNNFNMYCFCFGGKRRSQKFFDLVYKEASIFMDRKYKKFRSEPISIADNCQKKINILEKIEADSV